MAEEIGVALNNEEELSKSNLGVLNPQLLQTLGILPEEYQSALLAAEALAPQKREIDPAMASFLFFNNMARAASQPGATVLGSAAQSFEDPAKYLMQVNEANRAAEQAKGPLAVNIAKSLKVSGSGTGTERAMRRSVAFARKIANNETPSPEEIATFYDDAKRSLKPKRETLPNGTTIEIPGVDILENIRIGFGSEVFQKIKSFESGVVPSITTETETETETETDTVTPSQDTIVEILPGTNYRVINTEGKEMSAATATSITNSKEAIANLKIAADIIFPNGQYARNQVLLGQLPVVTGKTKTAFDAIRRVLEVLLRLRTGAAAPPSEVENYFSMYAPGPLDSAENAKIKFKSLGNFFKNIQKLLAQGRVGSATDPLFEVANVLETAPAPDLDNSEPIEQTLDDGSKIVMMPNGEVVIVPREGE